MRQRGTHCASYSKEMFEAVSEGMLWLVVGRDDDVELRESELFVAALATTTDRGLQQQPRP